MEVPTSMYHANLTRHTHGVHARKRLRDRGVMVETSRSGSWSFEPPRDSGQDTCLLVWTRHLPRDSGQGPDCPSCHSNQIRICPQLSHLRRRLQARGAVDRGGGLPVSAQGRGSVGRGAVLATDSENEKNGYWAGHPQARAREATRIYGPAQLRLGWGAQPNPT